MWLTFRRCRRVRVRNIHRTCMIAQWGKCLSGKQDNLSSSSIPRTHVKCQAWWQTPGTPTLGKLGEECLRLPGSQHSLSTSSKSWRDHMAKTSQLRNERKMDLFAYLHTHASACAQRHNNMTDRAWFCQMNCAYWMIRDAIPQQGEGWSFYNVISPQHLWKGQDDDVM